MMYITLEKYQNTVLWESCFSAYRLGR